MSTGTANRLSSVTGWNSKTTSYAYDDANRMTTTTLPSGTGVVHDGLGSTMKTVDATGTVVNGYTYDIYGKKTSSTGTQANEFDFTGQQTDPTGLQYLRARYYDPATGGFVSREPMAVSPGWTGNPTSYAGANPARYTDPTGLYRIEGGESGSCSGWRWLAVADSENSHAVAWWEGFVYSAGDRPIVRRCWILTSEKVSESRGCGDTIAVSDIKAATLLDEIRSAALLVLGIKVSFSGQGHWSRHLEQAGISPSVARATILADVGERLAAGSLKSGANNIAILIEGRLVQYTAYVFNNGAVNVGRAVLIP